MVREQQEGNIAIVTHGGMVSFSSERFPVAEDLWGCVAGSASFFELLHEYLSNDHMGRHP